MTLTSYIWVFFRVQQVVTFDCEKDVSHQRLCASVGVRHYPSVLFVGHGSYHASDPVSVKLLGAAAVPDRTVMYKVRFERREV